MMAFDSLVPGQKTIRFHSKSFFSHLHNEGCAEIDQICIANVGKQCIGETFWALFPQRVETGFPEKVDEILQG
jgi:hypothetical protein